ncbi:MAG: Dot/Icm type IV secretion system effector LegD1 [Wenzhouxiangellaceae bacterium]
MPSPLTRQQCSQFARDGYLVLENWQFDDQCQRLRCQAQQLLQQFDPGPRHSIFDTRKQTADDDFLASAESIHCFFEADAYDDEGRLRQAREQSINKIGHALHELDPVFTQHCQQPELARLAIQLGLRQPRAIQSMYIFKQPRIGGEVVLHQDATFLYTIPQSVIGLWFALEDATLENGCLQVLAGAHRQGLKRRFVRTGNGATEFIELDQTPLADGPLTPLPVKAGSLVVLHGLLPHYSAANRSSHSRQAYTLHLIDGEAEYAADNWLQRASPPPALRP